MNIFNLFNKLGDNNKNFVGIYVSPKSILEVVVYDLGSKQILKYTTTDFSYDSISRQISNIKSLELDLQRLFDELRLPANIPVVMTVPTIYMAHQTLPAELEDDELSMALTSETERNYFFIKQEPAVSWSQIAVNAEANTRFILFSAALKQEVDQIQETINKMGINLVAIDSSYAALLRGLSVTGIVDEDIREGKFWSVLLITSNSYVIISLMGNKIIDIMEDPLAIKSLSPEDIYSTITSYSIDNIKSKSPDHVIIISNSNDVSARELSTHFELSCKIDFIEQNQFAKEPLFEGNADNKIDISLEAIGTSCWKQTEIPTSFNFLSKASSSAHGYELEILGQRVVLTTQGLQNFLLAAIVVSIILMGGSYVLGNIMGDSLQKSVDDLNSQLAQVKNAGNANESQQSLMSTIYSIYNMNKKLVECYSDLGGVIPEKLWLESVELHDSSIIVIKGKAYNVEDVMNFYQNLVHSTQFNNLKITSIKEVSPGPSSTPSPTPNSQGVTINSGNASGLPTLPVIPDPVDLKIYEFELSTVSTATSSPSASTVSVPSPTALHTPTP